METFSQNLLNLTQFLFQMTSMLVRRELKKLTLADKSSANEIPWISMLLFIRNRKNKSLSNWQKLAVNDFLKTASRKLLLKSASDLNFTTELTDPRTRYISNQ